MKHPIPAEALKQPVAIVGTVGSGKTFTGKSTIEPMLADNQRVWIVDPTGAWWGVKSSADGKSPGFKVVIFGGDHADVPIDDRMGEALGKLAATTHMQAVLDISGMTMGGRTRFVRDFLEEAYHRNKASLYLVIDEADLFAPQRPLPDQQVLLNRCEQIVRRGRIKGFRVMMITQRPAELHKSVLSQAGTLVAMKLTAPQDRNAIGAWIEGQGDAKKGKALLEDLPRLRVGEGYVWCPSLDILEKARFPEIATFDSSRTPEPGDELLAPINMASVDLSKISAQLKAEVEEAEANDVPALHKRIKELEAKLAAGGESRRLNLAEAEACEKKGYDVGYLMGRRHATARARQTIEAVFPQLVQDIEKHAAEHGITPPAAHENNPERGPSALPKGASAPGDSTPRVSGAVLGPKLRDPSKPWGAVLDVDGSLSKGGRKVLTVLAQNHPKEVDQRRAAAIAGYSQKSSTWRAVLTSLRKPEFITGTSTLTITPTGLNVLGSFEKLPTGRALLDHWAKRLPKGQAQVLAILSALGGQGQASDVALRAAYTPTSSTWRAVLSGLRAVGLIEGSRILKLHEDLR